MRFNVEAFNEPVSDEDLKIIKIHPAIYKAMEDSWHMRGFGDTIRELAEDAIAHYIQPGSVCGT